MQVREMNKWVVCFLVFLSIWSCTTTKYVPVEVERMKKEYITRTDSVYIKDSVEVKERIINDTVFIEKLKYRDRYITQHDTIFKTDSIPVIKTVEVEKKVGFWETVKNNILDKFLLLKLVGYVFIIFLLIKLFSRLS